MKVLLFYEHITRELASCNRISSKIQDYEDAEVAIFSIVFEYYDAIRYARERGVDVVVMPWLYSDRDYELVMPFLKINSRIIVVNLHHEQIFSDISRNILLPKGNTCANNVIHLVWGDGFKNELVSIGVTPDLIYVTGNVRTDSIFESNGIDRQYLSRHYGLDSGKKWVLYCENRDWIWANKNNMRFAYTEAGCLDSVFERFYMETVESLEASIKDIQGLGDAFFDHFELIYRPHPGTLLQETFDSRVHVIPEMTVYDWFRVVDANVVSSSTAVFESDMFGVASFIDNCQPVSEEFLAKGITEYPRIDSLAELTEGLITATKVELAEKKIFETYIGVADGECASRVAEVLREIYEEGNLSYSVGEVPINRSRYFLKYLREKAMKFVVLSNLLPIIKLPRLAYRMRNDIPYSDKCT